MKLRVPANFLKLWLCENIEIINYKKLVMTVINNVANLQMLLFSVKI